MEIVKCIIPRVCCICREWGGWKNPTIDSIKEWDYDSSITRSHHHVGCVADAICNPEDYSQKTTELAIKIFNKINKIDEKETKERVQYRKKLAKAQDKLCKQGG